MAVKVKIAAEGVWSWIAQNPSAVRADRIKAAMRKAQKQAVTEWAQLPKGGNVGLALRFQPEAFGVLGLSERSTGYMRQQKRTLGGIYPYVAPLTKSGQLSPSGAMRRAVLGGGWSVTGKNGGGNVVTTQMTITGARILNRLADPWRTKYTSEFLQLDRGGKRDAAWIVDRANTLAGQLLLKEMRNAQRTFISGQASAQNGASEGSE